MRYWHVVCICGGPGPPKVFMSYDFIILQNARRSFACADVAASRLAKFVTVSATTSAFHPLFVLSGRRIVVLLCEKATLNVRALSYSDIIFDITLGATKRSARLLINGRPAQQRHTSPSFVSRLTLSLKNNIWTDVYIREEFRYGRAALSLLDSAARKTINDLMPENKDRVLFLRARVSSPGLSAPTSNWRPF